MQRRHWAVSWLSALLLAWLLSLIVVEPVAAQATITPNTPCTTSKNLTNLSSGGSRGITNQPVISGNGQRVAFWSVNNLGGRNVDGNIEVFVGETGDSAITQLTDSVGSILGGFNLEPSINTAGTHIAFYSDRDLVPGQNADGNFEIFLARRANNGTWSIIQVTNTEGSANLFPSINDAGDHIAFVSDDSELHNIDTSRVNADRNFEIFLASIPNSGSIRIRQITNTGAGVTNDQPAINAKGDRIAFTASTGQSAQVFVWDAAFGAPTQLTQSDINDQASISADGTSIVYIATGSDDRSRVVLHTLSLDGTESRAEVIVPSATNTKYRSPSVSGNGERVVYVAEQGTGTAIQINVLLYDVNTGLGVPISEVGGGTGEQPAISRDGTRVTFVGVQAVGGSTDDSGSDIYINECPQADLVLSFVNPPATSVLAGIDVFYQFQVTNRGPSVANNAYFRSDLSSLPALPNGVSRLLPSGCDISSSDVLTCSLGNIGINATRAFTMGYQVPSDTVLRNDDLAKRYIVSNIEVGANSVDPDTSNNSTGQFSTLVFEEATLRLAVTASPATILAGDPSQELTYELRVTNDGPSQARTTQITNTLPIGANFINVQLVSGGGSGAACSPPTIGSRVVSCQLGNMAAGASAVVRIRVTAAANSPASWSNEAKAGTATMGKNPGPNVVTVITTTPIERSADMAISKTTPQTTVVAGREITYTIHITNNGFSDTTNARVVDTLPTNVSYARSVLPAGGSCSASGGTVTCTFPGAMVVGAARAFQLVGLVSSTAPATSITNVATVSSDRGDPIPANNTTPAITTPVIRLADLGVTKVVNSSTPDIRSTVIYTVTARNNGPSQATSVVVTDVLPLGLTFVSATVTPGAGSYNSGSGLWSVGTLNVNQEHRLVIRATILDSAGGVTVTNTATVGSSAQAEPPGSTLPNTASVNIVPQSADIVVGISSSPSATAGVAAGERLTYTLHITNTGPTMARSVRLTDTLFADVFFVESSSPGVRPACSHNSGVVTCNVGNMNAGVSLDYTVVVTRAWTGLITNNLAAYSLTPDVDLANNTAVHTIKVNPAAPDYLIFTQQPPATVIAGEDFSPAPVVEIRDRFDNLVDVGTGSDGTVRLQPHTDAVCTLPASPDVNNGVVDAVAGVAIFPSAFYTYATDIYLEAVGVGGILGITPDCSTMITVKPAETSRLLITTPLTETNVLTAGRISNVITVQRSDAFGNPTIAPALTVELTSTSASGYFVDSTPITITTVQIPEGDSTADFYFTDQVAGPYMIHVSTTEPNIDPDSRPITVVAGKASALLVVLSAPLTVTAGVQSGDITIARIDDFHNENSSDPDLTVLLDSDSPDASSYEFYNDDGSVEITRTVIFSGTSRATFLYDDTLAGERTLTFVDEDGALASATMTITVVPSTTYRLIFSTAPITVTAGVTSDEIRVAREDFYGNRNFDDPPTPVLLASTSISNPTFSPSSLVTITQSSDWVGFTYNDRLAGTHTITASSPGIDSDTQLITITAAAAMQLKFLSPSRVITAGVPSDVIVVERQDEFGNGRADPADPALVVTLATTSTGTTAFLDETGTTTLPSGDQLTIAAGESQASFTYRDTLAGTPVISVTSPSYVGHNQMHTVVPNVLNELLWSSISPQTNNEPFDDGTITARDAYENVILDFNTLSTPVTLSVTNRPTATVTLSDNNAVLEPANFVNGVANLAAQGLTYRGLLGNVIFQAMAGTVVNTTTVSIGVGALDRVILDGPSSATAGEVFTVTLTALDISGNRIPGSQTVSFDGAVAALDGTAPLVSTGVTTYTFNTDFNLVFDGDGQADVRLFLPHAVTTDLSATVGIVESNELEVDVLAAETLAELLWQVTGPQGNLTPFTNGTITARDQYSNTILNFHELGNSVTLTVTNRPTATLTLSDTNAILEPENFVNGVADLAAHELTYSGLVGDVIFRATAGSVIGETIINITVGALSMLELTGPSTATANTPFLVTLTARDASGNLISDTANVIFEGALPSPNHDNPTANGTDFGNSLPVTFVDGVADITVNLTLVEVAELVASVGTIDSNELTVNVSSGVAASLALDVGTLSMTAGVTRTLLITAYDDVGNVATGYVGTKSLTFSGPQPSTRPAMPATVVDNAGLAQPIGSDTTLTFVNGVVDQTGNAADFRPTHAETGVTLDVSDGTFTSNLVTFDVTVATIDKLSITPQVTTVTAGEPVSLSLRAEDAFGNLITTNAVANSIGLNRQLQFMAVPTATAPSGKEATVTRDTGLQINMGSTTIIDLPSGISSVTGTGGNGVLRIWNAGTFVINADNIQTTGVNEAKPSGALTITVLPAPLDSVGLAGPSTATAGESFMVTLSLFDEWENPISGAQTVSLDGAVTALDGTEPSVTADGSYDMGQDFSLTFVNGEAEVEVFLPHAASTTITATVGGVESNGLVVNVVAAETLAELLWQVTGPQGNLTPFTNGTITARDQYSNTILNFHELGNSVTLTVTNRPTATLTLSDTNAILEPENFVNGVADLAAHELTYSGLVGDVIFRATADSVIGETTINITVGALSMLELTGPPTATANASFDVVLIGRDPSGNLILDSTHVISFTGALASPGNLMPMVDGNLFGVDFSADFVGGQVTLPMTLTNAALTEITAHIGSVASNQLDVNVSADTATRLGLIMAGTSTLMAGEARPLTITAYDDMGNVATGYDGAVAMTFSGPQPSTRPVTPATVIDNAGLAQPIGTDTTLTFVNGVVDQTGSAADFHPTLVGTDVTLDVTDGSLTSNVITFTVVPGALDKLAISPMNATVTVGEPLSLSLRVEDAFGNLISTDPLNGVGNNQPIEFSASPSATAPNDIEATVTDDSNNEVNLGGTTQLDLPGGVMVASMSSGVLRIPRVGTFVITADNSATGTNEAKPTGALTVTVLPGPLNALEWAVTGSQANTVPFANGTLTALDAFENIIEAIDPSEFPIVVSTGVTGTVEFADSSNNELDAADFNAGVADVSVGGAGLTYSGLSGNVILTATTQSAISGAATILIEPGPLNALKWAVTGPQTNGTPFDNGTLTALDAFENLIENIDPAEFPIVVTAGVAGTVEFTDSSNNELDSADFVGGVADVSVGGAGLTYTGIAGNVTLTATAQSANSGTTIVFIEPGLLSSLTMAGATSATAGASFDVTLTAEDSSGNPIPDGTYNVTFDGASAAPNLIDLPTVDGNNFGASFPVVFAGGSATLPVVLFNAAVANLTATLDAITTDPHTVTVDPDVLDELVWDVDSPQEDTVAFSLGSSLTAQDQYANVLTDFDDSVAISEPTALGSVSIDTFTSAHFSNGVVDLHGVGFSFSLLDPLEPSLVTLQATAGAVNSTIDVYIDSASITSLRPAEDVPSTVAPEQSEPNRFYLPSIRQPHAMPTPVEPDVPDAEISGEQASVGESIFMPLLRQ